MIGNFENISEDRVLTNTSKFILPLLFENINNKGFNKNKNLNNGTLSKSDFINAFYNDLNLSREQLPKSIYLLYKETEINTTTNHELNKNLINKYRRWLNNEEYLVKQYLIPIKYTYDSEKIIEGKFSEISQPVKEKIKKFWDFSKEITAILDASTAHLAALSKLGNDKSKEITTFDLNSESIPEEIIPNIQFYEKAA